MLTRKSRKKYDGMRALVVNELAEKYGITAMYVRQILRGDAGDTEVAEAVKKEYPGLYKAVENVFKTN